MSDFSASVGLDFSLLNTELHAVYEKDGADGYSILIMPAEVSGDNSVSLETIVNEIVSITQKTGNAADKNKIKADITNGVNSLKPQDDTALSKIKFRVQMAFFFYQKNKDKTNMEYAFQLEIVTQGLIPEAVTQIVDVHKATISIWQTERPKVLEKMALTTIEEYLGKKEASK